MCRFVAYIGEPLFMSELISGSCNSLIAQAMAAREAKTEVNADGCGLGWYAERTHPGTYRSVLPAWSDPNLMTLAEQVRSGLFMAHIRSATTGEVAYANCHPFTLGEQMFMHNGMISDYRKMRAQIERMIDDEIYENVKGSTDSEALFHAALSRGLKSDPVNAMMGVLHEAACLQQKCLGQGRVRFAAMHSDGGKLWAYRWSTDDHPPSLYYQTVGGGVVVASEPLDDAQKCWTEIPRNTVAVFNRLGLEEILPLTAA